MPVIIQTCPSKPTRKYKMPLLVIRKYFYTPTDKLACLTLEALRGGGSN